jgi:hypothetical protein
MFSWQEEWKKAVGHAFWVMKLPLPVWRSFDSNIKIEQVIVT